MVTIKDIAEVCGISMSTASRAIRGNGYVSKEIKEKVEKARISLGYVPNAYAKSLKGDDQKSIGIIISDINNHFYSVIVEKLINIFETYGYRTIITYSFEDSNRERENINALLASKVCAILFIPTTDENKDLIEMSMKRDVTLLQMFRKAYDNIASITIDDSHGAYLATNYLLNKGLNKILLISVQLKHTPHRSSGYKKALAEKNIDFNADYIVRYSPNKSIVNELKIIINKLNPDGIIAGTNTFGLDVLEVLKYDQKKPDLVVFDEMPWAKVLDLTTIQQPIDEVIDQSANYIIESISKKRNTNKEIVITPSLIKRK